MSKKQMTDVMLSAFLPLIRKNLPLIRCFNTENYYCDIMLMESKKERRSKSRWILLFKSF